MALCLTPLTREERRREGKSRVEERKCPLCNDQPKRKKQERKRQGYTWMGHGWVMDEARE